MDLEKFVNSLEVVGGVDDKEDTLKLRKYVASQDSKEKAKYVFEIFKGYHWKDLGEVGIYVSDDVVPGMPFEFEVVMPYEIWRGARHLCKSVYSALA